MKILVTGGAGFIGSHVVDSMVELGHEVLVVDNLATGQIKNINPQARFFQIDICSPQLRQLMTAEKPQVVSHHAAQTLISVSIADPLYDAEVNVRGTLNLLLGCVENGVGKVIFASSGSVYGNSDKLPISEEQRFDPLSPYSATKAVGEYYLRYFAENHGLAYTALRYANVYGPRDLISSKHVITVFSQLLLQGQTPIIDWDGEQAKDYVHIADAVRANLLVLQKGDNQAYNIGTGQPLSVDAIFTVLTEIIQFSPQPQHGPKRPGDVRLAYFDCSKAQTELGWSPQVSLTEGLRQTVDWYRRALVALG